MTYGSLGSLLGSRRNSYNTIRLFAAASVLISHAFVLTTGNSEAEPLYDYAHGNSLGHLAVGCFFALSGMLITKSFMQSNTIRSFVFKRAVRLLPGLWAALLVCLAVGAFVTTFSPLEYFSSPQIVSFLANAVFAPSSYGLPGTFEKLPIHAVNGSLWTLKFEVASYAAILLAGLVGLLRPISLFVLTGLCFAVVASEPYLPKGGLFYYIVEFSILFRFFGCGAILYLLRDRVPVSWLWACAAWLALGFALASSASLFLTPPLLAYATLSTGLVTPSWFERITERGDISYGVYVYAFPIQQLLMPISLASTYPAWTNIALAMPLTFAAGAISWISIERPALKLKLKQLRIQRPGAVPGSL